MAAPTISMSGKKLSLDSLGKSPLVSVPDNLGESTHSWQLSART